MTISIIGRLVVYLLLLLLYSVGRLVLLWLVLLWLVLMDRQTCVMLKQATGLGGHPVRLTGAIYYTAFQSNMSTPPNIVGGTAPTFQFTGAITPSVQFSSVQFSSRRYLCDYTAFKSNMSTPPNIGGETAPRIQFTGAITPSVQFSSVQDGIYALGKAHMREGPYTYALHPVSHMRSRH